MSATRRPHLPASSAPAGVCPHHTEPPPTFPPCMQVARLKEDRNQLRDELDVRDSEVMQLQGQLVVLRNQVADEANWLSPLPDPYA